MINPLIQLKQNPPTCLPLGKINSSNLTFARAIMIKLCTIETMIGKPKMCIKIKEIQTLSIAKDTESQRYTYVAPDKVKVECVLKISRQIAAIFIWRRNQVSQVKLRLLAEGTDTV